MTNRVKVRALVAGLQGYDANDNPIELSIGVSRWMDADAAVEAEQAGKVQVLAGLSMRELKTPRSPENPKPPIRRYKRRDLTAEA